MNSQLQTALDIKSHTHQNNPFILKIHANSTNQQHIHLNISAHILKKLSLINLSQSKQLTDLYKQCLLDVIQNPLLDLKSTQIIIQLVNFLQYWQTSLGKAASWPHTRTCFYYLQQKLKKNKLFQNLDIVRLRRGHLQPNKKQYLSKIVTQSIHSQQLKLYISQLRQQVQDMSQNSQSMKQSYMPFKSQQFLVSNKMIQQQLCKQQNRYKLSKNILYSDMAKDWKQINLRIQQMRLFLRQNKINQYDKQRQNKINQYDKIKQYQYDKIKQYQYNQRKQQLIDLLQSYLIQKLPVLINIMRVKRYNKQKILQQVNMRKGVIQKLGIKQLTQIINITISKIIFNSNY